MTREEYEQKLNIHLKIKEYEQAIKEHIQEPIHIYNEAKGLTLENIDSCFKYSTVDTYTHKAFCKAVFLWSVEVWEWLRAEMGKIQAGERVMPETKEALIGELETAKPFNIQEFM